MDYSSKVVTKKWQTLACAAFTTQILWFNKKPIKLDQNIGSGCDQNPGGIFLYLNYSIFVGGLTYSGTYSGRIATIK